MRKFNDNTDGSVIPVLLYIIGLVVFGFIYWLLDGIAQIFIGMNIADTTTYTVYPLLILVWAAIVVLYVVFGGIWLVRTYNEQSQMGW